MQFLIDAQLPPALARWLNALPKIVEAFERVESFIELI